MNDTNLLRIVNTSELPQPLQFDKDYMIGATGSITGIEKKDNHDGTYTITHKLSVYSVELVNETGSSIVAKRKDNSGMSKKMRNLLWILHNERGISEDFETWYPKAMAVLLDNAENVLIQKQFINNL